MYRVTRTGMLHGMRRRAAALHRSQPSSLIRAMAGSAAGATTTQRAQAEDKLVTSPPEVIVAKRQQLAAIGPSGWAKRLLYRAASLPLWAGVAAGLAARAVKDPSTFTTCDPSAFRLTPPFPLEEEYISVNGIRLHAVSPGRRRDKPLLLFIHGFPECWYSWRHQMTAFAADWDVVALDMRGYNTSDKPPGVASYSLTQLSSDIRGAVSALGHSRATLVAHDWGGCVAWVTAGRWGGDLLDGLVVLGLPHLGVAATNMDSDQQKRSSYILTFQARGLAEQLLTAGNAEIMDQFFRRDKFGVKSRSAMTDADVDWYRSSMTQPGAATATLNYYRGLFDFQTLGTGQEEAWAAIRRPLDDVPVLVVHGADDPALGPQLLNGWEAALPRGEVHMLAPCSHWVQQDWPDQVNSLMADWFGRQGLPGRASQPGRQQQQQQAQASHKQ